MQAGLNSAAYNAAEWENAAARASMFGFQGKPFIKNLVMQFTYEIEITQERGTREAD